MFLIEMILSKKKDVLDFLHKRKTSPGVAVHIIITDARERSSVTKFVVRPYRGPWTVEHFPLSQEDRHEFWVSRPIS